MLIDYFLWKSWYIQKCIWNQVNWSQTNSNRSNFPYVQKVAGMTCAVWDYCAGEDYRQYYMKWINEISHQWWFTSKGPFSSPSTIYRCHIIHILVTKTVFAVGWSAALQLRRNEHQHQNRETLKTSKWPHWKIRMKISKENARVFLTK